jgi:hypothetical protein
MGHNSVSLTVEQAKFLAQKLSAVRAAEEEFSAVLGLLCLGTGAKEEELVDVNTDTGVLTFASTQPKEDR